VTERFSVISDGLPTQLPDADPAETAEWLESLDAVLDHAGRGRARFLMLKLLERAREKASACRRCAAPTTSTRSRPSASPSSPATSTSSGASARTSAGTPPSP
jgi:hypothetical protein